MTAADVLAIAEEHGVELRLSAPDRIAYEGPEPAVAELLSDLRRYKSELLDILAARELRALRWPAELPVCAFLIGRAGENCGRCGASWREHYSRES